MAYKTAVSLPMAAGSEVPEIEYVVELPYGNQKFSMLAFLPAVGVDCPNAVKAAVGMCKKGLELRSKKVLLFLPKFKVEWSGDMIPMLKELGISTIFSSGHLANVGPEDKLCL